MANMQHVIKLNNTIVEIISPVQSGYEIRYHDTTSRLVLDKDGGRVIERDLLGKMQSIRVKV